MKSFNALFGQLQQRSIELPVGSRSTDLLRAGVHEIGKKIVEEASEVWMAAEFQSNEELADEAAQLIYHIQLMLVAKGISLEELEKKL